MPWGRRRSDREWATTLHHSPGERKSERANEFSVLICAVLSRSDHAMAHHSVIKLSSRTPQPPSESSLIQWGKAGCLGSGKARRVDFRGRPTCPHRTRTESLFIRTNTEHCYRSLSHTPQTYFLYTPSQSLPLKGEANSTQSNRLSAICSRMWVQLHALPLCSCFRYALSNVVLRRLDTLV